MRNQKIYELERAVKLFEPNNRPITQWTKVRDYIKPP